jgi:glycosyltransferase involved in cell wall biosynthesis
MDSVLQVVADGAPGGGTTAVLGLCEDLQRYHQVILITQPGSYAEKRAIEIGIEVFDIDFWRMYDPHNIIKLRSLLRKISADIIHLHGSRAAFWVTSALIGMKHPPLAYTVHGYHFINKSFLPSVLGRTAARWVSRRVYQIVTVSEADRDIATRLGLAGIRNSPIVIYNGIDGARIPQRIERPDFDLVFMARMHRQKNPLFAIELIEKLKDDGVTLLMVGGGDLEAEARAAAKRLGVEHLVTFAGEKTRAEALQLLGSAKVFLLPSLWEGLPIAPMEAMFAGVPVVASNIPGTREVVENGVTGILVDNFDPDQYKRVILTLLKNEGLRQRLTLAGRQRAERLFIRSTNSKAYESLYSRICKVGGI